MINNRQGGRRRGRGGQRGQNVGGQPGNRQDNRQRGNAAQLLEKYKSMARDAQLAGDRVQTEYYLQFADHYFRVLSETRARFEEQNPRRERDDADEDDGDEDMDAGSDGSVDDWQQERTERPERQARVERQDRSERAERPARGRRPRRDSSDDRGNEAASSHADQVNGGGETIPFDILPPAIGRDVGDLDEVAEEQRPRRRSRAPRAADGDSDVAPAA